jgi:hypothetical protein
MPMRLPAPPSSLGDGRSAVPQRDLQEPGLPQATSSLTRHVVRIAEPALTQKERATPPGRRALAGLFGRRLSVPCTSPLA